MADLLKWCLVKVEYQLVLNGIHHYFILKKNKQLTTDLFAFETSCLNSLSGNGWNKISNVCSATILIYIYVLFSIISFFL